MYRGKTSRIFPIILIIVITIVVIAALVSAGQAILNGNKPDTQKAEVVDKSQESLLSIKDEASVKMVVRGPIVADEKFHTFQVVVAPTERVLNTFEGYLERPLEQKQFTNNIRSYDEFVHALDKAYLTKGDQLQGDDDDIRGRCATGRVYEFYILDGTNTVKRLWTSTCKGSPGSLKASVLQVYNLFLSQIPDGSKIVRELRI